MNSYSALAHYYDAFTGDVPYDQFADFYESIFRRMDKRPELVLDLACGTGSMSFALARRGYEVIGVDASADMLSQAVGKSCDDSCVRPIFLCQSMEHLDLYGTVQAAVCALDSVNYVTDPKALQEAFRLVHLFLEPGCVFIFDMKTPQGLRILDQTAYTRECREAFCVYQADYNTGKAILTYTIDLFERDGSRYRRETEYHRERAYEIDEIRTMLHNAGFRNSEVWGSTDFAPLTDDCDRAFLAAWA